MTYQDIGHLFFPIYLGASAAACLLSAGRGWRRHLWTAFVFGVYVILLFQLRFDGAAHDLGMAWYGLVAYVQAIMAFVAWRMRVRGWVVVTVSAAAAILLQAAYAAFSVLDMPLPRQGYFVVVNVCQCLQVGSLIVCAPTWPFLAGLWMRLTTKRREPWTPDLPSQQLTQPRQVISGTH